MKKCSECRHALLRFNNGNGATTCNLLGGRIVKVGHNQNTTPLICPYTPDPTPRDDFKTDVADPMKLTKENFHKVVSPDKFYVTYVNFGGNAWDDRTKSKHEVVWKFVRIVEVEEDNLIFEVKTVEEIPRRITMSTNGDGWYREVQEVDMEIES